MSHTVYSKRNDIQVLRAVAVLLVILYHLPPQWNLEGGYIGVDIFFVISGFVITRSLLDRSAESQKLSVDYWGFVRRRLVRLYPPMAVTVVGAIFFAFAFGPINQFGSVVHTGLGSLFFSANAYFLKNFDTYWNPAILRNPFLHFWSLGVEFQVYLIWPLLVHGRTGTRTSVTRNLAVASALSFGIFAYFVLAVHDNFLGVSSTGFAFYSPFTRMWQLGLGGIAASQVSSIRTSPRHGSSRNHILAGVLIGASLIGSTESPGVNFWVVLACLGALIVVSTPTQVDGSVASRIMCWVGDRSYSIYLWHWPLLALALWVRPGQILWSGTAVVVSFGISAVLYPILERGEPIGRVLPKPRHYLVSISVIVVVLAQLVPNSQWFDSSRSLADVSMRFPDDGPTGTDMTNAIAPCVPFSTGFECNNFADRDQRIMVIGDSLAYRSLPAVQYWSLRHGYNTTMIWSGRCTFAKDSCTIDVGSLIYDYMTSHKIAAIFVAANFDRPADRVNASEKAQGLLPYCSVPTAECASHLTWLKYFRFGAEPGLRQLEVYSRNIVVSLPYPQQADFVDNCLQVPIYQRLLNVTMTSNCGRTTVAWQDARQGLIPKVIREAVSTHPNVRIFDPQKSFCYQGNCPAYINNGEKIMDDAIHWSWPAARFMVPQLSRILDSFRLPDLLGPDS